MVLMIETNALKDYSHVNPWELNLDHGYRFGV